MTQPVKIRQHRHTQIFILMIAFVSLLAGCKKEIDYKDTDPLPPFQRPVVELSGNITCLLYTSRCV